MDFPDLDQLAHHLVVAERVAPAACVAVGARAADGWRVATGAAGRRSPQGETAAHPALIYDLASVTKPFVALCAARLQRHGALDLDAPLATWVGESKGTPTGELPLQLLLAHRAGLEAHRELFAPLRVQRPVCRGEALREAACARRPDCASDPGPEGFAPCYSDLGYLLVGEAIARAAGCALDAAVAREVCEPLGISAGSARQWMMREPAFAGRVVPTEHVMWRGGQVCGVVHDENAWALAGHALAGHAGLFADAASVARLGAAVLDAQAGRDATWLSAAELDPLLRPRPGGSLRAGFDSKSGASPTAGQICGPRTFGHLGFTGTSLWCDPDADSVTVLLTNRVNPTRDHWAIRAARPRVHDALFRSAHALGQTNSPGSSVSHM